jgi:transcriptional regulator GlxA family with amidase domain
MPHITLLALPDALASSLSLPMEMLTAADQLARANRGGNRTEFSPLRHDCVGPGGIEIETANGLTLKLSGDIGDVLATDLLIIPALWRNPRLVLRKHPNLLPWLQQLARGKARLCAVGTGSFLLAEAGLLDNKPATTHWFYFDQFAQRYPRVLLQRHHLITEAGTIFCAGSVNSVADLTIHFIELFYGRVLARKVEAQFSPEIRQPFASHAYSAGHSNVHSDELVVQAQDFLRSNYAESVLMPELAQSLGISLRTLNRRFKLATGVSPNNYLLQQRLHNARELLRTSNLSIAEVAMAAGYSDSDYFSRLFRETMKQTPRDYRESVRGKLFTVVQ